MDAPVNLQAALDTMGAPWSPLTDDDVPRPSHLTATRRVDGAR